MLTVIWGSGGMQIIDLMTEQHSYNSHCLFSNVMGPLLGAIFPDGRRNAFPREWELISHQIM
jgi:hypothetical protein